MKTFTTLAVLVVLSLLSCRKDDITKEELLNAKGKVLATFCAGRVVQLIGTNENRGQNWNSSTDGKNTDYKNVVLLDPDFATNNILLGKTIEFKYKKVSTFSSNKPTCDLGIVNLDTLYQVYSFHLFP